MSMTGEAVSELRDAFAQPQLVAGDVGPRPRIVAPEGWRVLEDQHLPTATSLRVSTLGALKAYVDGKIDGIEPDKLVALAVSPDTVAIHGPLEDEETGFRRQMYILAKAEGLCSMRFGEYVDAESFLVRVASQFEQTDERDKLLAMISSIRDGESVTTADDGFSQEVKTQAGAAFVTSTPVRNPVYLRPFRTFPDLVQPESAFLLRLQPKQAGGKASLALYEADGGRWRVAATAAIGDWLRENLADVGVVA